MDHFFCLLFRVILNFFACPFGSLPFLSKDIMVMADDSAVWKNLLPMFQNNPILGGSQ